MSGCININIRDHEVEDLLRTEAKEELRSPTQQVVWILKQHYRAKEMAKQMETDE